MSGEAPAEFFDTPLPSSATAEKTTGFAVTQALPSINLFLAICTPPP